MADSETTCTRGGAPEILRTVCKTSNTSDRNASAAMMVVAADRSGAIQWEKGTKKQKWNFHPPSRKLAPPDVVRHEVEACEGKKTF